VTDHDLELRLTAACAIVREAGQLARDYFNRRDRLEIELKGTQDLVSIADRAVEDLIRSKLTQAFPDDDIIGEEGGTEVARPEAPLWVIDPIDGTANFLRGMPYWSVALALVIEHQTVIGVTYDPVHDELFAARRGHGATRDGQPIHVSGCTDPQQAVIASTFTFKMRADDYLDLLQGILRGGSDHRRLGSTALMMCHTADGRLDGCATLYCNSWDVIGGLLLVHEAGGFASDFLSGIELDQPNRALGCTPGLRSVIEPMLGFEA